MVYGMKQPWDVKRFNSNFPPKRGGYTLQDSLAKIEAELAKGENVSLTQPIFGPNMSPNYELASRQRDGTHAFFGIE